jgi:hypothetical protein
MDQSIIEAIKWTLIVLLAGFVGYFGRHLAMEIINKIKKTKPETKNINISEDKVEKYKYKLEKKKLKLNKKELKNK